MIRSKCGYGRRHSPVKAAPGEQEIWEEEAARREQSGQGDSLSLSQLSLSAEVAGPPKSYPGLDAQRALKDLIRQHHEKHGRPVESPLQARSARCSCFAPAPPPRDLSLSLRPQEDICTPTPPVPLSQLAALPPSASSSPAPTQLSDAEMAALVRQLEVGQADQPSQADALPEVQFSQDQVRTTCAVLCVLAGI
jgi:hypothetical protein